MLILRTCVRCGLLPEAEVFFYPFERWRCKSCAKAAVRANRKQRIDYYRRYDVARAMLPVRVAGRKSYSQSDAGRQSHREALRRCAQKYPEKAKARIAFSNAVRDGKIQRQPCEVCGKKAQGHHHDYSKPFDVRWLCTTHHREVHR